LLRQTKTIPLRGCDPQRISLRTIVVPEPAREGWRHPMSHYIAIFIEDHIGEWHVVFPDVPDCEAKGFNLDDVQIAAASVLSRHLRESARPVPVPMDMKAVAERNEWLERNHVDLSKAVVAMISVAA
jgi:hypothetical protein